MRVSLDLEKARLNGIAGFIVLALLVVVCVSLSVLLLSNPHKDLHQKIFDMAGSVRTYYRDQPGYWKLSTQSAIEDGLVPQELQNYKEYDIQIGQGVEGAAGLPNARTFDISVKHLNKSACISLSELDVSKEQQLALAKITILNEKGSAEFVWGGDLPLPIRKYSAREYCQPLDNVIIWTFE